MEFYYLHQRRRMNIMKLLMGRDQRVTILCNDRSALPTSGGLLVCWENGAGRIYCSGPQTQAEAAPVPVPPARRAPVWCEWCSHAALPNPLRAVATHDRIPKYSQAVVTVYLFLLCKQPITSGYYSLAWKAFDHLKWLGVIKSFF